MRYPNSKLYILRSGIENYIAHSNPPRSCKICPFQLGWSSVLLALVPRNVHIGLGKPFRWRVLGATSLHSCLVVPRRQIDVWPVNQMARFAGGNHLPPDPHADIAQNSRMRAPPRPRYRLRQRVTIFQCWCTVHLPGGAAPDDDLIDLYVVMHADLDAPICRHKTNIIEPQMPFLDGHDPQAIQTGLIGRSHGQRHCDTPACRNAFFGD